MRTISVAAIPVKVGAPGRFSSEYNTDPAHTPRGKRHCSAMGTSTASSPTTVTIDPATDISDDPSIPRGTAATVVPELTSCLISKPASDIDSISARALIAKHIRRVYRDFVCEGCFMFTDVFDRSCGLLTTPMEDPMGVVAAAITIMRYYYTDKEAKSALRPGMHMGLCPEVRHYMAAALFMAYKAKSEDSWNGGTMTRAVLSRFVSKDEYPNERARSRMAGLVFQAEGNLLIALPILSMVDSNIHGVLEHQLAYLMKPNPETSETPLLTPTACMAILSLFGCFYQLLTESTDTELVEELCAEFGMRDVALAFVQLGAYAIQCALSFERVDRPDSRLQFGCTTSLCAMRIIAAAVRKDFDRSYMPFSSIHLNAMTCRASILSIQAKVQLAARM